MNHKYHVLMPFTRGHLIDEYFSLFSDFRKQGVIWHPIVEEMDSDFSRFDDEFWVEPVICGPVPGVSDPKQHANPVQPQGTVDPCYWKLNYALDELTRTAFPTDRFMFMCDDDWLEPGFFEKIDKHEGNVIICSMHRGHNQPKGKFKHPATVILAHPDNMVPGRAGLEQIILSTNLAFTFRFRTDVCYADGDFIQRVLKTSGVNPVYADEVFTWFNFHEEGRWDSRLIS